MASENPNAGKVYVVAGPPASGKGTQCKRLGDALGLIHLSTGDIFREAVAAETELGLQVRYHIFSVLEFFQALRL
jgi:adenylate kinase